MTYRATAGRPGRGCRFRVVVPACLLSGSLLLAAGCDTGSRSSSPPGPPPAVPVAAALAVRKDVPVQLRAIGAAEAYSAVTVKTMVNGQITKVGFKEGKDVRKGDLIFVIDPRPYEAALKTAEATLAKDLALKENAEKDVKRYAYLIEKDLVPKQQFDQVVSNAAALAATVNADNAVVENSRVQLSYCYIRSPIDGRTGSLFVKEGNVVKANDTSLVTINEIVPVYVTFSVPEQHLEEIRKYRQDRPLLVEAFAPGQENRPARGTLTFVSNAVDNATGTIQLKATFPNGDRRLWPGQYVNVAMTLSTRAGAVLVPTAAVQTGQQGRYVFVVRPDMTVEARPVATGPSVDNGTVIEKGVQAGERVVTDGQLRLVPGSRVELKQGLGG